MPCTIIHKIVFFLLAQIGYYILSSAYFRAMQLMSSSAGTLSFSTTVFHLLNLLLQRNSNNAVWRLLHVHIGKNGTLGRYRFAYQLVLFQVYIQLPIRIGSNKKIPKPYRHAHNDGSAYKVQQIIPILLMNYFIKLRRRIQFYRLPRRTNRKMVGADSNRLSAFVNQLYPHHIHLFASFLIGVFLIILFCYHVKNIGIANAVLGAFRHRGVTVSEIYWVSSLVAARAGKQTTCCNKEQ